MRSISHVLSLLPQMPFPTLALEGILTSATMPSSNVPAWEPSFPPGPSGGTVPAVCSVMAVGLFVSCSELHAAGTLLNNLDTCPAPAPVPGPDTFGSWSLTSACRKALPLLPMQESVLRCDSFINAVANLEECTLTCLFR